MKIAPQGYRYIALLSAMGLALLVFPTTRWFSVVVFGAALFVAFFFRDPHREPPDDPSLLVSPGDGRVVFVGPAPEDPSRIKVAIFLSIFDVHINRSPMTAVVRRVRYTPGRFLAAYRDEASTENEQNELQLADGDYEITVRQIAGVVARRIICAKKENDRLARGERFGLIQFGSRMEVLMPGETKARVEVGDRVKGGETVLGERV